MDWSSFYTEAYAQGAKIDVSALEIKGTSSGGSGAFFAVVGIMACFILLGYLYNRYHYRKASGIGLKYLERKSAIRPNIQRSISGKAKMLAIDLARAAHTKSSYLLADNRSFEKAVDKVMRSAPSHPILGRVRELRGDLGFIFFNRRVLFLSSKMLQPGQKLRVSITYKERSQSFVATLLNSTENDFWITPPTVKGKSINISRLKSLEFRVFRKGDGEFQFVCELLNQIQEPTHAVVVKHTSTINRLRKRESDRFRLRFKRKLRVLPFVDKISSVGVGQSSVSVIGIVEDISIGGMKFIAQKLPDSAAIGVLVMFELKEAKIKQGIHGNIVKINRKKADRIAVHVQFYNMSELNRLHLNRFLNSQSAKKIQ